MKEKQKKRLGNIIDMLQLTTDYNDIEVISIAKGKYKIPKTFKDALKVAKR